jgi:hypothetical protein
MRSARLPAIVVACCALCGMAAGTAPSSTTLPHCRAAQLRLSGHLQGATQSLLGTLTVSNRTARACALAVAPSRATVVIGTQVLPALTVRMGNALAPPGAPARRLPARGKVVVGIQWRNWCGAPRGNVHLAIALTVYRTETRRVGVGLVRTPVCVDHKFSSRVAVSRFIRNA